jgi:uncharacterized repeat protein (TIGR03803 family)
MLLLFAARQPSQGQSFDVLYAFGNIPDTGYNPDTRLFLAKDGNFYGVTLRAGPGFIDLNHPAFGNGTVFKMSTNGTLTTVLAFNGTNGCDGMTSLIQVADGSFYGVTLSGGTSYVSEDDAFSRGWGTVFRLWTNGTLVTLYSFSGGDDGRYPCSLVQGSDGNFYGTTSDGGSMGGGTLFRITPDGAFTKLYDVDSANPMPRALVQGKDGHFYGVTSWVYGSLFRLTIPLSPILRASQPTNGTVAFTWNAVSGLTYQIQHTSDLTSTNWNNFGGPIVATDGTMSASDTIGPDLRRFYRVVLLQ